MGATIPDGQYYGDVTRTQRVADLVLSETCYARGATVPGHAHASPLWCLVLSGRLVEQSRGTTRTLGPGWVLLHFEDERLVAKNFLVVMEELKDCGAEAKGDGRRDEKLDEGKAGVGVGANVAHEF